MATKVKKRQTVRDKKKVRSKTPAKVAPKKKARRKIATKKPSNTKAENPIVKARRKSSRKSSKRISVKGKTQSNSTVAKIRMYRHGLGDCFLLQFPRTDSAGVYRLLIDCGLITVAKNPKAAMTELVENLATTTDSSLDGVVMTHEHWDHVSGFSTQQVQEQFDELTIGEVWYSWAEDPTNKLARKLRADRQAKLEASKAAAKALRQMARNPQLSADREQLTERAERVASLLGFFGVDDSEIEAANVAFNANGLGVESKKPKIGKTLSAYNYLLNRIDVRTRFLHPQGQPFKLPGCSDITVFVLGPPENEGMIKRSRPTRRGREVYEFGGDLAMDENLNLAFGRMAGDYDGVEDRPFDDRYQLDHGVITESSQTEPVPPASIAHIWKDAKADWRCITTDWTAAAELLALNLDNHTNNTCLVLAFELGSGGPVLLFPGDAQVGNWLSWQDVEWTFEDKGEKRVVSGPDLLSRTVFYKVGHHGSHNATLRGLGLEQMEHPDLTAFIPVSIAHARKSRWNEMPFIPLVERLREKTGGRVVLSDTKTKSPNINDLSALSSENANQFLDNLETNSLYYELSIEFDR